MPSTELGVQSSSPGFLLVTALTSMTKTEHQHHPTEPLPLRAQATTVLDGRGCGMSRTQLREAGPRLRTDLPGDMQFRLGSKLLLWLYFGKSVRPGVSIPSRLLIFMFGQ